MNGDVITRPRPALVTPVHIATAAVVATAVVLVGLAGLVPGSLPWALPVFAASVIAWLVVTLWPLRTRWDWRTARPPREDPWETGRHRTTGPADAASHAAEYPLPSAASAGSQGPAHAPLALGPPIPAIPVRRSWGGEPARNAMAPVAPPSGSPAVAVLDGGSSAGRAPWHLPVRTVQPGVAVDGARLGDLEVRAASVIGPSHRCVEPAGVRQDAYALGRDRARHYLVIAVADGLGSSQHSDLGARVAVSTAVRELTAHLDRGDDPEAIDVRTLFAVVAGEIVGTGRERGLDERDLCCLLVVAVVPTTSRPDGSRSVWTAQLGDVSVWTHGAELRQHTGPQKEGLDRNTVDAVLPFQPDEATANRIELAPGQGVAVLTDGVGDLLTDAPAAAAFLGRRWEVPPHPAEYLADLCLDAPGQDDDRTAVVVWCGRGDRPGLT